jgi:hypothetical protein
MVALEETSSLISTLLRRGSYRNLIIVHGLLVIGIIQSDLDNSRLEFGIKLGLEQLT